MNKGFFLKGIKLLASLYRVKLDEEETGQYYMNLGHFEEDVFAKAIENLMNNREEYMPSPSKIVSECEKIYEHFKFETLEKMYKEGYFHEGYEKLDDNHAMRNYEKSLAWLEKGIIPGFLKEDMIKYGLREKPQINVSRMLLSYAGDDND